MKQKSSIFISRINFTKMKKKQLYKSLLHTLRIILTLNVDEQLTKYNETYFNNIKKLYTDNENSFEEYSFEKMLTQIEDFLNLSNEEITEKVVSDITEITKILATGDNQISKMKNIKLQNVKEQVDVKLFIKRKTEEKKQEVKKLSKEEQKQKEELIKQKLELMINKMIDLFQNDVEEDEKPMTSKELEKLRDSIKTTRNRLKSKGEPFDGGFKDLSLEDYDKSNLTRYEFIEQNFKRTYNTEEQTKAFKKRTVDSLLKYDEIKNKKRTMDKNKVVSGTKTIVQELIFKPTAKGFKLTVEELRVLQKKIIDEETSKGNFILTSSIHNDESSPHIHFFISSKTFNILENQINFINSKYGKDFNIGMEKEQQEEYGRLSQKHYLELVNSCIQEPNKEFTLTHLINKEVEELSKDEQQLLEVENIKRINNNLIIKTRSKKSISKRDYNNIQYKIEENQKKSTEILIKSKKNIEYMENKKITYQDQLKKQKQTNEEELEKIRKRMLKEIADEKKQWEDEKIEWESKKLKEIEQEKIEWEQQKTLELKSRIKEDFLKNETKLINEKIKEKKEKEEELKTLKDNITNYLNATSTKELRELVRKTEQILEFLRSGLQITKEDAENLLFKIHKNSNQQIKSLNIFDEIENKYFKMLNGKNITNTTTNSTNEFLDFTFSSNLERK